MAEAAISVHDLSKRFVLRHGWGGQPVVVHAVESVSLAVGPSTTLGVVGESGCGKSTLGRMVAGLLTPTEGSIEVDGQRLASRREIERGLTGRVQMVFQDPAGALDPRMKIGSSVAEPLPPEARSKRKGIVSRMLEQVGLPASFQERLPHELSGGQQQRACIARALVGGHRVVVLDEVVSALDPIVRAQILDLLLRLQRDRGLSYLFISHDLFAVQAVSTHVAVMYLGELVEYAPVSAFDRSSLLHPYSIALLSSKLEPRHNSSDGGVVLSGDVPSPTERPSGCVFRTRCPIAKPVCAEQKPPLQEHRPDQLAACHFAGELSQ